MAVAVAVAKGVGLSDAAVPRVAWAEAGHTCPQAVAAVAKVAAKTAVGLRRQLKESHMTSWMIT